MREMIALALLCLFVAVASLGVMVWAIVDALLDRLPSEIINMDGLLLIAVCLLLAAIFGFCFAWLARDARLWERVKGKAVATNPDKAHNHK